MSQYWTIIRSGNHFVVRKNDYELARYLDHRGNILGTPYYFDCYWSADKAIMKFLDCLGV